MNLSYPYTSVIYYISLVYGYPTHQVQVLALTLSYLHTIVTFCIQKCVSLVRVSTCMCNLHVVSSHGYSLCVLLLGLGNGS